MSQATQKWQKTRWRLMTPDGAGDCEAPLLRGKPLRVKLVPTHHSEERQLYQQQYCAEASNQLQPACNAAVSTFIQLCQHSCQLLRALVLKSSHTASIAQANIGTLWFLLCLMKRQKKTMQISTVFIFDLPSVSLLRLMSLCCQYYCSFSLSQYFLSQMHPTDVWTLSRFKSKSEKYW